MDRKQLLSWLNTTVDDARIGSKLLAQPTGRWAGRRAAISARIERREQRLRRCVIPERFAEVRKAIDISRREDKAATQLKRIRAKFVLLMPGGAGPLAAREIVAAQQMQQVGGPQLGDAICLTIFVNQQWKIDTRFFQEHARIVAVAQADRSQRGASLSE